MRGLLLPLLLVSLAGCQALGAFETLVEEEVPELVDALERDAEARIKTTETADEVLVAVKKVVDWLDFSLAGCAAGIIALVSTWGKTAVRKLKARTKARAAPGGAS